MKNMIVLELYTVFVSETPKNNNKTKTRENVQATKTIFILDNSLSLSPP